MKQKKRGKGQDSRPGTPHQRADGRWVQWITYEAKRYKRSGESKQAVKDKITALLAELKSPARQKAKAQGPTLTELCEQLLAKYDADGSTYRTYTRGLAHWRRLLGEDTRRADITDTSIQAAIDELAAVKAPGTVATYFAALRLALGADHPALKDITLPDDEDEDEISVLVPADLAARLQVAAQRHPMGIAIGLGFGAGVRAGEAAALRWQDVDFGRGRLSINGTIKPTRTGWTRGKTKNRKTRLAGVSTDLIEWLQRHRRIQADTAALAGYPLPEFVIADPATGQSVTRAVPVEVLRQLLAAVCTPEELEQFGELRFHALRHTHISELLSQGAGVAGVADIAARVGQTPETLLRYYAHAIPGADERLAALAGALFPVFSSEANRVATLVQFDATQRFEALTPSKEPPNRSTPHDPAGSAEKSDPPGSNTRSIPQEPAALSNPLSNPEVR